VWWRKKVLDPISRQEFAWQTGQSGLFIIALSQS
jgi:hypothetical protein